jgi:hypothetical protein
VPPELSDLAIHAITLTPQQGLGIPVALVGAVFLALGAQFQHRGVAKVEARTPASGSGLTLRQLSSLLKRPSGMLGTLMLGLAVVFQLTSLGLAPIIVVQPLGTIALVITAIVNARVSRVRLTPESVRAIVFCVVGVGLFVTIAAFTATSSPISEAQLITVLVVLVVVTVLFALLFAYLRNRFKAIIYIVAAGVLYGFVATLAKVVIDRIKTLFIPEFHIGSFEWLTVLCVVALIAAAALGGYFVQSAYSSGPPDLVIAGLTVIDPLVAVTIGIVVLQEASGTPLYAIIAFVVAGALAVYGVLQLAKHHPQARH